MIKKCSVCDSEFEGTNRSKYCSDRCRLGTAVCETCSKEFIKKGKTTGRFCSTKCWYINSPNETKICTKCNEEKKIDAFPKSGGEGKLSYWCRSCLHNNYIKDKTKGYSEYKNLEFFDFAERIREERKKLGLTQTELGKRLGINGDQIAKWERGVSLPLQRTLKKIYKFFNWYFPYEIDKDGKIPLGILPCGICGEYFPQYKNGVKFCSLKCSRISVSNKQTGENNHGWKGGRTMNGGGYVQVKVGKEYPSSNERGYMQEHRYVMEQKLGRYLTDTDRVHHLNGNRADNRPENLELWKVLPGSQKDPAGQRVKDLIKDLVENHREELLKALMIPDSGTP